MTSAIVLAAGLSSRMGDNNKLLLPYKNKTIIENTLQSIISSPIKEVIIVLGKDYEKITPLIKHLPVQIEMNENFSSGLTSSIQAGILKANGSAYMLCLADMVLISSEEYKFIYSQFEKALLSDPKVIGVPVYEGKKGNPVVFSSFYKNSILNHIPKDGCKEIVQMNQQHVFNIPMKSDHILRDMDTIADYEKFK
jgi:molybdenum cofactor cytidylyltransferase